MGYLLKSQTGSTQTGSCHPHCTWCKLIHHSYCIDSAHRCRIPHSYRLQRYHLLHIYLPRFPCQYYTDSRGRSCCGSSSHRAVCMSASSLPYSSVMYGMDYFSYDPLMIIQGLPGHSDIFSSRRTSGFIIHSCRTGCIVNNYGYGGKLVSPQWLCDEADKKGIFPKSRIRPDCPVSRS